jgi:MFS family permease
MQLHLVSFGLIFGTGQSLVYASSFAILPHYFDRRLGFVMGILNAGSCILIIITSILIAYLLEVYGLVVTFLLMALLTITGTATSITYKFQIPRDNKHKDLKKRFLESLGIHIFKNPKFIVWLLSTFFGVYGNIVPILTMSHFVTLKFSGFKPEILNVIYGISSGISSILFGILIDTLVSQIKLSNLNNLLILKDKKVNLSFEMGIITIFF